LSVVVALAAITVLSLYRVLRGPTLFDRLTGIGLIGTKTMILLVLLGFFTDRLDMYVDISISYSLISFMSTLVLAKYFERREHKP
jgi:multicomponent Na+:H+ antiporter subunit F